MEFPQPMALKDLGSFMMSNTTGQRRSCLQIRLSLDPKEFLDETLIAETFRGLPTVKVSCVGRKGVPVKFKTCAFPVWEKTLLFSPNKTISLESGKKSNLEALSPPPFIPAPLKTSTPFKMDHESE